ncbi:MAG: hypothetical protein ACK6BZ_14825, partial [Candidatus Kapaibacterium sp.]
LRYKDSAIRLNAIPLWLDYIYGFNNFLLVLFSATLQRFCAALECNSIYPNIRSTTKKNT